MHLQRAVNVLVKIEREPETWNQGVWGRKTLCGSAFCFAGHAIVQEYGEAVFIWAKEYGMDSQGTYEVDVPGVKFNSADEVAAMLLELTPEQAGNLFEAGNSKEYLYTLVAELSDTDLDELVGKVEAEVGQKVVLDPELLENAQARRVLEEAENNY